MYTSDILSIVPMHTTTNTTIALCPTAFFFFVFFILFFIISIYTICDRSSVFFSHIRNVRIFRYLSPGTASRSYSSVVIFLKHSFLCGRTTDDHQNTGVGTQQQRYNKIIHIILNAFTCCFQSRSSAVRRN